MNKQNKIASKIFADDLRDRVEKMMQGTKFSLENKYGQWELWFDGKDRLEAGSMKDIYNALVKIRFKEKYATTLVADKKYMLDIAYEIVTEDSAEAGDAEDRGWEEQDLEFDSVYELIQYMLRKGATYEQSSKSFHKGIWYSSEPDRDYSTGEDKTLTYHVKGLDIDEEKLVYDSMKRRKNLAQEPE